MQPLRFLVGVVVVGILSTWCLAQGTPPADDPADEQGTQFPKSPWKAEFVKVGEVDLEKGTIQILAPVMTTRPVVETVQVPVTRPDGAIVLVTETRERLVSELAYRSMELKIEGAFIATVTGKRMALAKVPKLATWKGRDVILSTGGEIDPYYLKFLAPSAVIVVPAAEPPAPVPLAVPVPVAPTP